MCSYIKYKVFFQSMNHKHFEYTVAHISVVFLVLMSPAGLAQTDMGECSMYLSQCHPDTLLSVQWRSVDSSVVVLVLPLILSLCTNLRCSFQAMLSVIHAKVFSIYSI